MLELRMELTYRKYDLELTREFTISSYSRNSTPIILTEVHQDGIIGYGEVSLPQYLKENQNTVIDWLSKKRINNIYSFNDLTELLNEWNSEIKISYPALASVDIAFHDFLGKLLDKPCYEFYNILPKGNLYTSFTIGLAEERELITKILEAKEYKILKIKLGTENDKHIIETVRKITDLPLYIDANQGWGDKYFASEMIRWLSDKNVILIEQPMPVDSYDEAAWLRENSPLPIIADEAFQSINDIDKVKNSYSGVNIKLMKCGGIYNAFNIIKKLRESNLKVMLGCMTETSCAVSAAKVLAPLADYIDLDGNLLIKNDPFKTEISQNGNLICTERPGLGIERNY